MTESIVILPAQVQWAESFRLCVDAVSREGKYFLMTEAPPLDKVRDFLLKLNTLGHPHFFAVKGDRVVGWCNVKRLEAAGRTHVGELSMGLQVTARGKGLGRRLIQSCLQECRYLNYRKVELTVFSENERAIRLYKSMGFEKEGHVKDYAFMRERYKDADLMGMILN